MTGLHKYEVSWPFKDGDVVVTVKAPNRYQAVLLARSNLISDSVCQVRKPKVMRLGRLP